MSKHYLRKLDDKMGQAEYEMYRAIPAEEIGVENPAHWMSFDEWKKFIDTYIEAEFDKENPYIVFIMYLEKYPIGWISLGLTLKDDGSDDNLSYCVRPVCRGSGLAETMIELLKSEAEERGIEKLVGYANKNNIASWKAMEKCGFRQIGEMKHSSKRYELNITKHNQREK